MSSWISKRGKQHSNNPSVAHVQLISSQTVLPILHSYILNYLFFFFLKILFDREQASTSRGRDRQHWQREREKRALHGVGILTWGLIPGHWDHDLSWRQTLNWLSHPGASWITLRKNAVFLRWFFCFKNLWWLPISKRIKRRFLGRAYREGAAHMSLSCL